MQTLTEELGHARPPGTNGQVSLQYTTTIELASNVFGGLSTEFIKSDMFLRTCEPFKALKESNIIYPPSLKFTSSQ